MQVMVEAWVATAIASVAAKVLKVHPAPRSDQFEQPSPRAVERLLLPAAVPGLIAGLRCWMSIRGTGGGCVEAPVAGTGLRLQRPCL